MKPRLLSLRPTVTRTSRRDPRGAALESVAAEFTLLAQRRARMARHADLLGRQLAAACASLESMQARMAMLARRMDDLDPALRAQAAALPAAEAAVAPMAQPGLRAPARGGNWQAPASVMASLLQAAPAKPLPHRFKPLRPRRPFLPDDGARS